MANVYSGAPTVDEEAAPEGTSREPLMVEADRASSDEIIAAPGESFVGRRWKAAAITATLLLVGAVAFYVSSPCRNPVASLFRGNSIELVEKAQLEAASRHLKSVSREEADKMVKEAMQKAKEERMEQQKSHKLPPLRTMTSSYNSGLGQFFSAEKLAVQARKNEAKDIPWTAREKAVNWGGWTVNSNVAFRQAFCIFNVAETVDSLGGTGIDVESMVRTCPEPRDDISTFACSVNAETLAEMVGTAATWMSSAVSTCQTFPNVGAECSAGVAGIVGALGEVAASGTLAATSCKEFPLAGFRADSYDVGPSTRPFVTDTLGRPTPRISQVGAREPGRRLFMGSGIGGTGVQCGVDVGFIVDNIYDTVFYIHQAVQLNSCKKRTRYGAYNYLTGVPEAACALDIAGAIAWITQIATFAQQLISHCPDLLELPTLCGSSITGMVSAASQMASWGSQIAIACGESESVDLLTRVIVFNNTYDVIDHHEVVFVKLCSAALSSFNVICQMVSQANANDFDDRHLPAVTLVGPYEGLVLAEAEIQEHGLDLPEFGLLDYNCTVYRPHGTGVRRLEGEKDIWDPENHPSMRNLREAMKELQKIRANLTETGDGSDDTGAKKVATQARLKDKLHLIEPALHEHSSKWSIEELDTC